MNISTAFWPEMPLKRLLTYLDERVQLEDMREYITITVKRRHGGLEERERLFGHQIKTKKQFRLFPGALIISRVQCWHQAYALVPDTIPQNMIASTNYDQFAISPEVDRRFFWWLTHSPRFTETIRSSAVGVVIEKMVFDREAWLEKTIPLPTLAEQQRIVARIEELAVKIEEARGLRQQTEEEADALMASSVTRALNTIPLQGRLGNVLLEKPRNGWSARCDNAETGVPVLALGAVTGFQYRENEFKRTSEPTSEHAHYWLREGELLTTRSNTPDLVGHTAIYNGSPAPCIYPDLMMRLPVDDEYADRRFVHYWLRSVPVREYIGRAAKGTSPTMKKISQGAVMNIPFPSDLPLPEQRRIVAYLDDLQARVGTLKKLQAEIAADLDALLPSILDKAFKGEL